MQFQHIIASDMTIEDGQLLAKAVSQSYDGDSLEGLAVSIRERDVDVWRIDANPRFLLVTTFEVGLNVKELHIHYAAGDNSSIHHRLELQEALDNLINRLGCDYAKFISTRRAAGALFGAEEVARLYIIRKRDDGQLAEDANDSTED